MDVRFVYDLSYVKQMIKYLGIPFLIFIVISASILLIYSIAHKNHDDPKYKYNMNLYTLFISIILVASLFAILVGFALAFKKQVDAANIQSIVTYIVLAAPILPLISLIALFIKAIRLMKNKPVRQDEEQIKVEENTPNTIAPEPTVGVDITEVNTPENSNSILNIPPASSNMFSSANFFPNPNIASPNDIVPPNNSETTNINNNPQNLTNPTLNNEPVINEINETVRVIEENVQQDDDIETL